MKKKEKVEGYRVPANNKDSMSGKERDWLKYFVFPRWENKVLQSFFSCFQMDHSLRCRSELLLVKE